MAKKRKFRLLCGTYSEPGGVTIGGGRNYEAGDIVESEHDLIKMFVNKFEKYNPKAKEEEDEETPPEPVVVEESTGSDFGVEVSDQFHAGEFGLRVFRNETGYVVVETSNPTEPLNETPLKNKQEAQKFCRKHAVK